MFVAIQAQDHGAVVLDLTVELGGGVASFIEAVGGGGGLYYEQVWGL